MAVELPALIAKIKLDDKEYTQGVANAQTKLEKFSDSMKSAFTSMEQVGKAALVPFTAITGALGGSLKAAGDYEAAMIRMAAATGGNAEELAFYEETIKKVRSGSEETMATVANVTAKAKQLGSELGLTNEQIGEIVLVSENLSTIWGGDMMTTMQGLMYGMTGFTRGLKQFGIYATDERLQMRLDEQGIEKTVAELNELEKAQLIYQTIMETTAEQLELADAAGSGFLVQISRVKNAFIDLGSAVGQNFLGDFVESLKTIGDKIIELSQNTEFTKLVSQVLEVGAAVTGISVAIGVIGKIGNSTISGLGKLFGANANPILQMATAVGLLLTNMEKFEALWNGLRDGLTALLGSSEWADMITKVAQALTFVVAISLAADAGTKLMNSIQSMMSLAGAKGSALKGFVVPLLITVAIGFIGDKLADPIAQVGDAVKESFRVQDDAEIKAGLNWLQTEIYNAAKGQNEYMQSMALELIKTASGKGFLGEGFLNDLYVVVSTATFLVVDLLSKIPEWLNQLGQMIREWFDGFIDSVPGLRELMDMITGKGQAVQDAATAVTELQNTLPDSAGSLGTVMEQMNLSATEAAEAIKSISDINITPEMQNHLNETLSKMATVDERMNYLAEYLFGMNIEALAAVMETEEQMLAIYEALSGFLVETFDNKTYKLKIEGDLTALVAQLKALNLDLPDLQLTGKKSGGYTGAYPEDQVAGVVHGGEWVAPAWMVKRFPALFDVLEQNRRGFKLGGYVSGGFASGDGFSMISALGGVEQATINLSEGVEELNTSMSSLVSPGSTGLSESADAKLSESIQKTQEKQSTAFSKAQDMLINFAKKVFNTIKDFIVNPLKEGIMKVLSPAFERLQEPLYRLGLILGEILLPIVEALMPVFEALAVGLAYVVNAIIGLINGVISLINMIPYVNIPLLKYIDIGKLTSGMGNSEEEEEASGSTAAGWHQPITNNFTITFTGNTVLDTDDKSLETLSDALIRYWKDKGVKVFA